MIALVRRVNNKMLSDEELIEERNIMTVAEALYKVINYLKLYGPVTESDDEMIELNELSNYLDSLKDISVNGNSI